MDNHGRGRAWLFEITVGVGGFVLLAAATATGSAITPDQIPLAAFLLVLSFLVKRLGFRVTPEVTHSLGSTTDLIALLISGIPLAGWIASLSTLAATVASAARPGHAPAGASGGLLFNAGLKGMITLACGSLLMAVGGAFGPTELPPSLLLQSAAVFGAWVLLDHAGWGLLLLLRGGAAALSKWLPTVFAASVLVELTPLPLSLLVAVIYGRLGGTAFLLAAAAILGLAVVIGRLAGISFDLRTRVAELTALNRMGEEILQARLDPDQLCELIYQQAGRIVDTSTFQLGLFEGDDYVLKVWVRHGERQTPTIFPDAVNEGIIGWMRGSKSPLLVHDFAAEAASLPAAPRYISPDPPRSGVFVPLLAGDHVIGALAIQSYQRASFTESHVRLLTNMANQAASAIRNAQLQAEAEEKRLLEQELNLARQIQASLLPACCPLIPGYQLSAAWLSARQVSGDFYDYFQLPGGRWGLLIGDVSGKGVPAALFMALSRSLIRSGVLGDASPATGLQRANEWILKDSSSGLFVTVFYVVLDPAAGTLRYVNCGHNPALRLDGQGRNAEWLGGRGIALGMFEAISLEEHTVALPKGSTILLYTDGVTEARGADDTLFGRERLGEEAALLASAPVEELVQGVLQAVGRFTGDAPQSDDITLVALRRES